MDNLLAGRLQMAFSLGFHIVFACIGMVMPFLMAAAHWRWVRHGEETDKRLAQAWARGVAIFFAVGAVSGTMLSFELGLLWPTFMEHAGPIISMPFSLEGSAFFLEAIALGLFLYGWGRMNKWVHFGSGVVVGICGVTSGILVVAANAWMNAPAGFEWVNGQAQQVDPIAAMFNDAWFTQALHMILAGFVATSFGVAGVHAYQLLRHPGHPLHQRALRIAMTFGVISAVLQPLSGDLSAKDVAQRQPAKLAAMEGHFQTERGAGLWIGGIPDEQEQRVRYGVQIPYALSFLAHGDPQAEVTGLDRIPRADWPPVAIVHISFQLMVGLGVFLMVVGLIFAYARWRRPQWLDRKWLLRLVAVTAPLGFLAVEAGWIVTEVGRQPWIIQGVMRTSEALTPMPGLVVSLVVTTAVYLLLTFLVYWLMSRQIKVFNQLPLGGASQSAGQDQPASPPLKPADAPALLR